MKSNYRIRREVAENYRVYYHIEELVCKCNHEYLTYNNQNWEKTKKCGYFTSREEAEDYINKLIVYGKELSMFKKVITIDSHYYYYEIKKQL